MHTPGTQLNDQYPGDWARYFAKIRAATPPAAALGITDYFTLAGYKAFLANRAEGDLPSVELVFPNIEMRLTTETRDGKAVNAHLLFSPRDARHIQRIEERLARLTFDYRGVPYPLTDSGLRDLGRAHRNDTALPDEAALRVGVSQFKVSIGDLVRLFQGDAWLQENGLIAIAAGKDGLGGLSRDDQFAATREEMGRQAHIIFSGSPTEREFWLGNHPDFANRGLSPRPCLHGSDAHSLEQVLQPDGDRRSWIIGDATFESLKQTTHEPARRVHIGPDAPRGATAGFVIDRLDFENAAWIENATLTLNEGLVTVIGAKGSGKTALADLLAFVSGADEPDPGSASFLRKARHLIQGLKGTITWADMIKQEAVVDRFPQPSAEPRVLYLSQQFVERLSAADDVGEPLVQEIERVVFNAIPEEDRLRAGSFGELREAVLEGAHASRDFNRQQISADTLSVAEELRLEHAVPTLTQRLGEATRARATLATEIASIPAGADPKKAAAHNAATAAVRTLQGAIALKERRAMDLREVSGSVERQLQLAEQEWNALKVQHGALLSADDWAKLRLGIGETGLARLAQLETEARADAAALRDRGVNGKREDPPGVGPAGITALTARAERLAKELGADQANAVRRAQMEGRLAILRAAEERARQDLDHAKGAAKRKKEFQDRRLQAYDAVFETLQQEQDELTKLYSPLRERLKERKSKLAFDVRRVVDLDTWIGRGEALLDLRRNPWSAQGYLRAQAREHLLEAWSNGSSSAVRVAMRKFLEKTGTDALSSLLHGVTPAQYGDWLFSTDHIRIRYGIDYEGVPLANLSPGTRGVVLLTLYLSLDEWDLRPLVIDQPEENLDPSSVFSELVPYFQEAARRRQIIMVTHNANLVVNTDSDQVIIATSRRTKATGLPKVKYTAGGLEDPAIREAICELLEGGREAFRMRARRYALNQGP